MKSPAWLSTFAGVSRPETAPVKSEPAVIVTLVVDALKLVIVFPPMSWAVSVFVPVNATPSVCEPAERRRRSDRAPLG